LGRIDQTFYDRIITAHFRAVDNDIVIVAIDERSLSLFGPRPWHRNFHAELLRRIAEDQPRAIGLDLMLSDPDMLYPEHDVELAEVIRNSQKVVLPMRMEERYVDSPTHTRPLSLPYTSTNSLHHNRNDLRTQILPLPLFYEAAAAVGNIHLDSDFDGIVRSVSLRDRIGSGIWENFAVKMLRVGNDTRVIHNLPPLRPPYASYEQTDLEKNMWSTGHAMQIPFAGPPGKIPRISYADVINRLVPPDIFHNKYVLVGITAVGMGGESYPTPVSIGGRAMSSVEVTANIMNALIQGFTIEPVTPLANTLFSLLPVAGLLLSLIWLSPRRALLFCLVLIIITIGASYFIVRIGGYWYPPSAGLLGLVLCATHYGAGNA